MKIVYVVQGIGHASYLEALADWNALLADGYIPDPIEVYDLEHEDLTHGEHT
jgi:hypothetical protein